ncbi:uncharacterized protein LOC107267222 isoform X2 [Cephus cinctus]|uniref:Uncharacterized protein LOC107267222 isoform X2 n=1 Tax=Cephus cinctus TaxID=211228 RepID=A0AAJ7BTQ8_CEPCN|nr:uncharacterized protein LOC107267222 isoform X2 [Cephus cinctus]
MENFLENSTDPTGRKRKHKGGSTMPKGCCAFNILLLIPAEDISTTTYSDHTTATKEKCNAITTKDLFPLEFRSKENRNVLYKYLEHLATGPVFLIYTRREIMITNVFHERAMPSKTHKCHRYPFAHPCSVRFLWWSHRNFSRGSLPTYLFSQTAQPHPTITLHGVTFDTDQFQSILQDNAPIAARLTYCR